MQLRIRQPRGDGLFSPDAYGFLRDCSLGTPYSAFICLRSLSFHIVSEANSMRPTPRTATIRCLSASVGLSGKPVGLKELKCGEDRLGDLCLDMNQKNYMRAMNAVIHSEQSLGVHGNFGYQAVILQQAVKRHFIPGWSVSIRYLVRMRWNA